MTTPALKSELGFPYRLPKTYVRFLWALHFGAAIAVCVASFDVWAKAALCFAIGLNGLRVWHKLQRLKAVTGIYTANEQWWLSVGSKRLVAEQTKPPVLLHWLVILYFKVGDRTWSLPILAESTSAEAFRRLKILLNR